MEIETNFSSMFSKPVIARSWRMLYWHIVDVDFLQFLVISSKFSVDSQCHAHSHSPISSPIKTPNLEGFWAMRSLLQPSNAIMADGSDMVESTSLSCALTY